MIVHFDYMSCFWLQTSRSFHKPFRITCFLLPFIRLEECFFLLCLSIFLTNLPYSSASFEASMLLFVAFSNAFLLLLSMFDHGNHIDHSKIYLEHCSSKYFQSNTTSVSKCNLVPQGVYWPCGKPCKGVFQPCPFLFVCMCASSDPKYGQKNSIHGNIANCAIPFQNPVRSSLPIKHTKQTIVFKFLHIIRKYHLEKGTC